jgi:hypothetical protein
MAQSYPGSNTHDMKEKATGQFEKMADKAADQFDSVIARFPDNVDARQEHLARFPPGENVWGGEGGVELERLQLTLESGEDERSLELVRNESVITRVRVAGTVNRRRRRRRMHLAGQLVYRRSDALLRGESA